MKINKEWNKYHKKYKIKALNGFIYIEKYRKGEELERAKIYDENCGYIDYISLENTSKREYYNEIKDIVGCKFIEDLLERQLFITAYDCDTNLKELLYDLIEPLQDEECIEELDNDLKNLNETQLVEKYEINKIGDYYFHIEY